MKVLYLTFYYEPDATAGAFRSSAIARSLVSKLDAGSRVDVLATMPNRFSQRAVMSGLDSISVNLNVWRFPITSHANGMLDQSRAFLDYARQVISHAQRERYDIVVSSTARLMTGVLGDYVAKSQCIPHYLDIRDIFCDVITDLFRGRPQHLVVPIFRWIERRIVSRAARVNLVSPGFESHHSAMTPSERISFFTNGVDDEFIDYNWPAITPVATPTVLYAGNIGDGQGLHGILPEIARLTTDKFKYKVIGVGGRFPEMVRSVSGLSNVTVSSAISRSELLKEYAAADVLLLHLNNLPAFRKVLPSKVFEYAATGKPIVAGVSGFAAEFIRSEIENAVVFEPANAAGMAAALGKVTFSFTDRNVFVERYRRSRISSAMADDIISVAEHGMEYRWRSH